MYNVLISAAGLCGATLIGSILGLFIKELPHKWNDAVLGYCAGIMLAVSTIGLIVPAFQMSTAAGGPQVLNYGLLIASVMGGALFLNLLDFVTILQEELIAARVLPQDYDFEAHKELVPMQPGDVPVTFADTTPLEEDFGFRPCTPLRDGLRAFALWYAGYYGTCED